MKTMRLKIEVHRKQRKSYRRFIFKSIMFCREIFDKLLTEQNRQTRRKRQKKTRQIKNRRYWIWHCKQGYRVCEFERDAKNKSDIKYMYMCFLLWLIAIVEFSVTICCTMSTHKSDLTWIQSYDQLSS